MHGDEGLGVLFFDDPNLFGDFELRLQWKAFGSGSGEPANSGVFLRTPRPPRSLDDANFYDRAVEIQIDDSGYDAVAGRFRSPLHRTGAIYRIAPARVRAEKASSVDEFTRLVERSTHPGTRTACKRPFERSPG